jgi:hypothetical protein
VSVEYRKKDAPPAFSTSVVVNVVIAVIVVWGGCHRVFSLLTVLKAASFISYNTEHKASLM